MQTAEKGKAVAASDAYHAAAAYDMDPVTDWQDYSNFYDEYDDDEEVSTQNIRIFLLQGHCNWVPLNAL